VGLSSRVRSNGSPGGSCPQCTLNRSACLARLGTLGPFLSGLWSLLHVWTRLSGRRPLRASGFAGESFLTATARTNRRSCPVRGALPSFEGRDHRQERLWRLRSSPAFPPICHPPASVSRPGITAGLAWCRPPGESTRRSEGSLPGDDRPRPCGRPLPTGPLEPGSRGPTPRGSVPTDIGSTRRASRTAIGFPWGSRPSGSS
jgi:hypothetical protein